MSDREIRDLLRRLNLETGQGAITRSCLGGDVFRVAVVTDRYRSIEPRGGHKAEPHAFYAIRSADGRFVAAVHDAVGDLHWYIVRPYRGQGLMSNALRRVILPHIAATGRTVQHITISRGIRRSNFGASQRLATSVGFRLISDGDVLLYELDLAGLFGPIAVAALLQAE